MFLRFDPRGDVHNDRVRENSAAWAVEPAAEALGATLGILE
jgi:hypothetical protein